MNGAASAAIATETILGDGPTLRGNKADLVTRLATSLNADGQVAISTNGVFNGLTNKYGLIASSTTQLVPKNIAPIGALLIWVTSTAPTHWLLCTGQTVSRTTYADLFAVVGVTYGVGDGSTTFNVPDLRARVVIGLEGGTGRITTASVGGANSNTLGGVGGAEIHTLSIAEMPIHDHQVSPITGGVPTSGQTPPSSQVRNSSGGPTWNTDNTGGGGSHSNTQPWAALNFIIYAGA